MQHLPHPFSLSNVVTALALVFAAAAVPVLAGPSSADSPDAVYKVDRANCLAGRTQQDLQTCLKEAGAARDSARKGLLKTESPQVLRDNALARCQVQPEGPARSDCERLARGEGTVSGSVAAGGDLKELHTIVPAKRRAARPAQAAASAASAP